jgi:hypothetical protein
MSQSINRIVFLKRSYRTTEELYARVSQQLHLLMETGYVCVLFEINIHAGEGAVVIEFNPNSKNHELQQPHWLFPDEADYLETYKREVEIEEHKEELERLESEKYEEEEEEEIVAPIKKPKKNKGDA